MAMVELLGLHTGFFAEFILIKGEISNDYGDILTS